MVCVWFWWSSETDRNQISTCVCTWACVSVHLYSPSKEKSPLITAGGLVSRDLQAMERLAWRQLLALTIAFPLEQALKRKLFKKDKRQMPHLCQETLYLNYIFKWNLPSRNLTSDVRYSFALLTQRSWKYWRSSQSNEKPTSLYCCNYSTESV